MIDLTDIGKSTRFSNGKADAMGMITPLNIVKDMVDLVFENIAKSNTDKHIKEYRFIDICCKSGNFLRQIYVKLMEHTDMKNEYEDRDYRSEYILNYMLYGICFCESDMLISTRNVYGRLVKDSNIKYIPKWCDIVKNKDDKFAYESLKETFGDMQFDIVIGNPPYNNDMYIDFVQLGKKLIDGSQHGSVCMITPAKWQAKGGEKNEAFRRDIVPYMSKIAFYPNAGDIFNIRNLDGISYFLISKTICRDKCIKNVDNHPTHSLFNQDWHFDKLDFTLHSSIVNNILSKCSASSKLKPTYNSNHKYLVHVSLMLSSGGGKTSFSNFSDDGKLLVLNPMTIEEIIATGNYKNLYSSDSKSECESYISYMNTKLMRFILYVSCCGNSVTAIETWRFVPDPGKFDHIFTDAELYQKYGLTEEEITIIENIIKERK